MKPTGEPDLVGEVRYQPGAVAAAAVRPDAATGAARMVWEVRRERDSHLRYTPRLAHVSHWAEQPIRGIWRYGGPAEPLAADAPAGTLFYPDCSNNNWNSEQDAIDFVNQLAAQGFSGMCHKVSEGDYYEDPFWPVVLKACQAAGIPCLGYHYVTTNSPGSQAQTYQAAGGLPNAMFDWEANGGDLANYYAVANGFNTAGVNVGVGYCPQWYWSQVGGGDLTQAGALVSSAYPGASGYASQIYANGGGDTGSGWNAYGGVTPTCWQFTDRANIAGLSVDCNAFKGTPDQLAQLFTGAPVTQPQPQPQPASNPDAITKPADEPTQVSELWDQELIRWDMLGGHTIVEALAAIGQKLGIPGFTPPAS